MQIKRIDDPEHERQMDLHRTYPLTRHWYVVRTLLTKRRKDTRLWNDVNEFTCRHCLYQAAMKTDIDVKTLGQSLKKMTFRGIRLHVKAKHGIDEIADEDVLVSPEVWREVVT